MRSGADKVAINTAATENPKLLAEAVKLFGSQCIVSSIEAFRRQDGKWQIWVDYGRQPTDLDAIEWAKRVIDLGVGEILLTSINREGMGNGYDLELTEIVSSLSPIPVIVCGGAGNRDHFVNVIKDAHADAVAAASVFHYSYAAPVSKAFMSYEEARLRMGEHIDSGNIDFLNHGYGGQRAITVDPANILEIKQHLKSHGINVRISSDTRQ